MEIEVEEKLQEYMEKVRVLIPPFLDGELIREEIDQLVSVLEASKERIVFLRMTIY